ncbi:integrase, catalytic region, zinc finger, CCHC-type containing protein [Tanacetum coccineum]
MELENSQNNALAKLPMLKLGEYEMWEIRIKQYFQIQDYALWEVIENGNSWVPIPVTTTSETARFGGKKQQEDTEGYVETYKGKKFCRSSNDDKNLAFVTTSGASSTNNINTVNPEVSTATTKVNTASTEISTASFSDATMVLDLIGVHGKRKKFSKHSSQWHSQIPRMDEDDVSLTLRFEKNTIINYCSTQRKVVKPENSLKGSVRDAVMNRRFVVTLVEENSEAEELLAKRYTRVSVSSTSSQQDQDNQDCIIMPNLEDASYFGPQSSSEDTHVEDRKFELGNIPQSYAVPTTPHTRIHKDHPIDHVIGDVKSYVQTRRMTTSYFSARFSKTRKNKRGIVIRNKARLDAHGHIKKRHRTMMEVFAPVARIEAIRMFLAYASYMGFMVYQMDVKSAFLYGQIEEEHHELETNGDISLIVPNFVVDGKLSLGSTKKVSTEKKEIRPDIMLAVVHVRGFRTLHGNSLLKLTVDYAGATTKDRSQHRGCQFLDIGSLDTKTNAGKRIYTEASLRRHLKLDDHDVLLLQPNRRFFELLTSLDITQIQKSELFKRVLFYIMERIRVLEDDLKKTKLTYSAAVTKLILRGRKLSDAEVQEKASTETEPFIQEVTPTEVIQDQGSNEKGNSEVSTAGVTKGTASEVPVISTVEENISTAGRNCHCIVEWSRRGNGTTVLCLEAKSTKEIDWNDPSVISGDGLVPRNYKVLSELLEDFDRQVLWTYKPNEGDGNIEESACYNVIVGACKESIKAWDQQSKSDLLTEPTLNPHHIDEFNLNNETSISEYDEEEQNILYFNDLFPSNIIRPDDLKSEKDNDDNDIDIIQSFEDMALPPREQRHHFLKYEGLEYSDADISDFKARLARIYRREVHRVQVFDFRGLPDLMAEGLSTRMLMEHRDDQGVSLFTSQAWRRLFDIRGLLIHELILGFYSTFRFGRGILDLDTPGTLQFQLGGARRRMSWREFILALGPHTNEEMQTAGFGAYWADSARQVPDNGDLRDYWIGISYLQPFLSIARRSQAPEKVTVTDLFYLRVMDIDSVNVPYLLARYLRLFVAGRRAWAHITRRQFVARLAEHFRLLTTEILRGLTVIAPELLIIDMAELVRLQICAQFDDTWAWVAIGPERQPDTTAGAPAVAEDAPAIDEGNQAVPAPV